MNKGVAKMNLATNDNDFILTRDYLEKNNIDYYEYSIAGHFITALEYNDLTGLNNQDLKDFESFIERLPLNINHFEYLDLDNTNFKKCEICNLYANCITALGIIIEKKES
jgi:hypothetical protein